VETLKRETARAQHEMQNLRDEVKSIKVSSKALYDLTKKFTVGIKSAEGTARPLVSLGEDGVNDLAECLLRAFSGPTRTRSMK
jgi:phage shock protein A